MTFFIISAALKFQSRAEVSPIDSATREHVCAPPAERVQSAVQGAGAARRTRGLPSVAELRLAQGWNRGPAATADTTRRSASEVTGVRTIPLLP